MLRKSLVTAAIVFSSIAGAKQQSCPIRNYQLVYDQLTPIGASDAEVTNPAVIVDGKRYPLRFNGASILGEAAWGFCTHLQYSSGSDSEPNGKQLEVSRKTESAEFDYSGYLFHVGPTNPSWPNLIDVKILCKNRKY